VFYEPVAAWEECESTLCGSGVPIPFPHRLAWVRANRRDRIWFIGVEGSDGEWCGGFAVQVGRSRALPGYLILRVERLGVDWAEGARQAALLALANLAMRHRILRVHVELFGRNTVVREASARTLHGLGFHRAEAARTYADTIVLDLDGTEKDILASLHKTGRQNIRSLERMPVVVRAISDLGYCKQMDSLLRETMQRTGGLYQQYDWNGIIQLSKNHPDLSRVAGLFRTDVAGTQPLLAYAWGRRHGDHVEYHIAASTRSSGLRVSLGYGPAWDLIMWAKQCGARWFDFGGVTLGKARASDALAGISDFKRYFSRGVVTVGEEWVLEPRPLAARVAATMGAALQRYKALSARILR
jgi:hypothetical protein